MSRLPRPVCPASAPLALAAPRAAPLAAPLTSVALARVLLALGRWARAREHAALAYVLAENRALRAQLGARRVRLDDATRAALGARAHAVGRAELAALVARLALANPGWGTRSDSRMIRNVVQ